MERRGGGASVALLTDGDEEGDEAGDGEGEGDEEGGRARLAVLLDGEGPRRVGSETGV